MARKPTRKELQNSRLLKEYASWIYCKGCGKTAAYLCYVTYDAFDFEYVCKCGNHGSVRIEFEHSAPKTSGEPLKIVKNRLCCPTDDAPLLTLVEKNLAEYAYRVLCNACNTEYRGERAHINEV